MKYVFGLILIIITIGALNLFDRITTQNQEIKNYWTRYTDSTNYQTKLNVEKECGDRDGYGGMAYELCIQNNQYRYNVK